MYWSLTRAPGRGDNRSMVRPPIKEDINDYLKSGIRDRPRHLTTHDKLIVIWGLVNRWSEINIAAYIGMSKSTVHSYKNKIVDHPQIVFEQLPLYTQIEARKFRCRICREQRPSRPGSSSLSLCAEEKIDESTRDRQQRKLRRRAL